MVQQLNVPENNPIELRGAEKAAALFLVLAKKNALQIAKYFTENDIKKIVSAAADLRELGSGAIDQILLEFGENYNANNHAANSDKLLNYFLEANSQDDQNLNAGNIEKFDTSKLDFEIVKKFFQEESPQLGALLLRRLDEDMIVEIILDLKPEVRNNLFSAFLNRNTLREELQSELEFDLLELLAGNKVEEKNVAEIDKSANLINQLSSDVSDEIIGHIGEEDPQIAETIRKSMFKFSSIELLSKEDTALLLDGIEPADIVNALFEETGNLRECILDVLSQRNRRMVESELSRIECTKESILKSQKKFVSIAQNLTREGKIAIPAAS